MIVRTGVSGDLQALSHMSQMDTLILSNTAVSGDLSALAGMESLTNLLLTNTDVSGSLASLGNVMCKSTAFARICASVVAVCS